MPPEPSKQSTEKGTLLVVGLDSAALAISAYNAGYHVHVVDLFGDLDVKAVAERSVSLIKQTPGESCGFVEKSFSPEALVKLVRKMTDRYSYEGILLSSGLDDSPAALEILDDLAPIIGNSPEAMSSVRDKRRFFESLERNTIPHPRTHMVSDVAEARAAAGELGYPLVVKPNVGQGGANVRLAWNLDELLKTVGDHEDLMIQEYVKGTAASVSLMATRSCSKTLTTNLQLIGVHSLGSSGDFTYCGNVLPLDASEQTLSSCSGISAKIGDIFGLLGSNGVDLVIDDAGRLWVVEANPRFQGTLECVESALGINLLEAHLDACLRNRLPEIGETKCYCARLILYGRERSVVPDLRAFPEVRDTPLPGVTVEKGEPLCSVSVKGANFRCVLLRGFERAEAVYSSLCPRATHRGLCQC